MIASTCSGIKFSPGGLEEATFLERNETVAPDNDMIEQGDPDRLGGGGQVAGRGDVFRARRRIAWSRDRAHCTSLDVYVSPSPSPNRTCTFQRIRLSIRLPSQGRLVLLGFHRSALTSLLQLSSPVPFNLTAFLRHVAGFPDLRLLRRLRPIHSVSRRLARTLASELCMVPKFTQIASTRCLRSCLYALHGSLPRSIPGNISECGVLMFLPLRDYACPSETSVPASPPSSFTHRMVQPSALQTAVSFVTIATLWLAAPTGEGSCLATLSEELQTPHYLWYDACPPSHLHTPLQGSVLERSIYALLGAPAGMVVDDDDAGGVGAGGCPEDVGRANGNGVELALVDRLDGDDFAARVEERWHAQLLLFEQHHLYHEQVGRVGWGADDDFGVGGIGNGAAGELERRAETNRFGARECRFLELFDALCRRAQEGYRPRR